MAKYRERKTQGLNPKADSLEKKKPEPQKEETHKRGKFKGSATKQHRSGGV